MSDEPLSRARSSHELPDREQFDRAVTKVEVGVELLVSRVAETQDDIRRGAWLATLREAQAGLAQVIAALGRRTA